MFNIRTTWMHNACGQEALHNVQRHSEASAAEVELVQKKGRLRLMIRDQGNPLRFEVNSDRPLRPAW